MFATRLAIVLVSASPLLSSGADKTVASLSQVQGNVLVSTGAAMASATQPVRLVAGMRVLPTSHASAVVVFDDGCRVQVAAGERYVVENDSPCRAASADELPSKTREARR